MEGAFLAHSVYGFFQNGGQLAWIVRVGNESRSPAPRAALPAAGDGATEALRATAQQGITDTVTVEIGEEVGSEGKEPGDVTYNVVVSAGSEREEYPGRHRQEGPNQHRHQDQRRLEADQARGDRRAAGRDQAAVGQLHAVGAVRRRSRRSTRRRFEGDVATRKGIGGVAALDEVTMLVMPDIVNLNGDGAQMRDIQGKMIAHCENAGGRMAILDAPPDLLPQDVLEWRMNTAGYDSKMAALYWPWIEVMDPLTKRPMMMPPSGHIAGAVVARRRQPRRPQGAGQRGRAGRQRAGVPDHAGRAGRAQPGRDQRDPRVPRSRYPDVGSPDALQRPGVALHQRSAAVQLRLGLDHGRARSGACSSPTTRRCGPS